MKRYRRLFTTQSLSLAIANTLLIGSTAPCCALDPIQTAGTLNRAFNPEGFMITSSGARVTGAGFFSGSLVVDLGGNEQIAALDINQSNGTIVTVFSTNAGPQSGGSRCGLTVTKQDGTLDTSFNPSGLWIIDDGTTVTGGYSGTLIISHVSPGNNDVEPTDVVIDQSSGNIIFVAEQQFLNILDREILVTVIKPDGTIDPSFNPSAQRLNFDGSYGGSSPFSGVFAINAFNLRNYAPAVAYDHVRKKIVIAFKDAATENVAIITLNPTGDNPVDRNFNPSGFFIDSDGSYLTGGYSGVLRIDLGGDVGFTIVYNQAVAVDQATGKIIAVTNVATGPGVLDNVGIIVANPTGHILLDPLFNPSGAWMQSDGSLIPGGYSGTLVADLGGNEDRQAVAFDQELRTIVVASRTDTGLTLGRNLAVLNVTATGARNAQFNPSGIEIDADGSTQSNGTAGLLVINSPANITSSNVGNVSVAIDAARNRIIAASQNARGNGASSLRVNALSRTDAAVLEHGFNPQALNVGLDGQAATGIFAYSGLFRADLEIFSAGIDIGVYLVDATINAGVARGDSPVRDPQLFSINGVTLFPPPPPLSALFNLPYIVMGAA